MFVGRDGRLRLCCINVCGPTRPESPDALHYVEERWLEVVNKLPKATALGLNNISKHGGVHYGGN